MDQAKETARAAMAAIAGMFEKVAEHSHDRAREVEQAVERVVELGLEKR